MRVTGLLAAVLVLAGCSSAPDPSTLADRSFSSTSIDEGGKPKELWPGTTLQISFIQGELSATGGCNSMFGKASLADGKVALTGEMGSSVMACLPEVMAQDDWFAAFLKAGPTWALDGDTLTLTTPQASVTLQDTALD